MTSWPPASSTRHSRSPTNAPRALPMVSGPVGFADTNSTLTRRGRLGGIRPHASGAARISATVDSNAASARRRLTNPGRATSTEANRSASGPPRSASASASAMSSGERRRGRASCMARLVAKSPKAGFEGRSTVTAGASAPSAIAVSDPVATAASQARPTASRTRGRMAAWAALDGPGLGTDRSPCDRAGAPILPVQRDRGPATVARSLRSRTKSKASLCRLGDNSSVRASHAGFWLVLSQRRAWYVRQRGASRCAGMTLGPRDPDGTHTPECVPSVVPGSGSRSRV